MEPAAGTPEFIKKLLSRKFLEYVIVIIWITPDFLLMQLTYTF